MKISNPAEGNRLQVSAIRDTITEVMNAGSKVSKELFRAYINKERPDSGVIKIYLGTIQDFLTSWRDFFDDVNKKMDITDYKFIEGVKGIPYNVAKPYIYANYDYLSILPVMEGLFRCVKELSVTKQDDLDNYINNAVEKAFDGSSVNVASIIDEIIETFKDNQVALSVTEGAKFKAVSKQKFFNYNDVANMMRAFEKVLTYMADNTKDSTIWPLSDALTMNIIVDCVAYINYSVAAYMKKIVMIYLYAYPYINGVKKNEDGPVAADESIVEAAATVIDKESTVIKEVDEMLCREVEKFPELVNKYMDCIGSIGASLSVKVDKDDISVIRMWSLDHLSDKDMADNLFAEALMSNGLFEWFKSGYTYLYDDVLRFGTKFETLKHLVYAKNPAIKSDVSEYSNFLYILRNKALDAKTVDCNKKVAADLLDVVLPISAMIFRQLITDRREYVKQFATPNLWTTYSECCKVLADIYKEINVIALYRLRDIELRNNELQNKEKQDALDELSIKVPGLDDDKIYPNDNMMSALPDYKQVSAELPVMYAAPLVEAMKMYEEFFVKPLFDQEVYTEAVDFRKIIDTIIAAISAAVDRVTSLLKNGNVKKAVTWVRENRTMLLDANYSGEMVVIPYKRDIGLSWINDLVTNINAIDLDSIKYPEGRNEFLKKLYFQDDLVNLFESNKDAKVKKQQFENYIFTDNYTIPADNKIDVQPKELKDAEIKNAMETWVDTLLSAETIADGMDRFRKTVRDALNKLKTNASAVKQESVITEADNNQTESEKAADEEKKEDQQGTKVETPANENDQEKKEEEPIKNNTAEIIADIDKAIGYMIVPLGSAVRDCILKQYGYIQQAYKLIQK